LVYILSNPIEHDDTKETLKFYGGPTDIWKRILHSAGISLGFLSTINIFMCFSIILGYFSILKMIHILSHLFFCTNQKRFNLFFQFQEPARGYVATGSFDKAFATFISFIFTQKGLAIREWC